MTSTTMNAIRLEIIFKLKEHFVFFFLFFTSLILRSIFFAFAFALIHAGRGWRTGKRAGAKEKALYFDFDCVFFLLLLYILWLKFKY